MFRKFRIRRFELLLFRLKFSYLRFKVRFFISMALFDLGYRFRMARFQVVYGFRLRVLKLKYRLFQFKLRRLELKHKFLCSGVGRDVCETLDEVRECLEFAKAWFPCHSHNLDALSDPTNAQAQLPAARGSGLRADNKLSIAGVAGQLQAVVIPPRGSVTSTNRSILSCTGIRWRVRMQEGKPREREMAAADSCAIPSEERTSES